MWEWLYREKSINQHCKRMEKFQPFLPELLRRCRLGLLDFRDSLDRRRRGDTRFMLDDSNKTEATINLVNCL